MSKADNRRSFLALIKQAATELKGICKTKETTFRGNPCTLITVIIEGKTLNYPMGKNYSLEGKGAGKDILIALFGPDRVRWPTCLPGSRKKVSKPASKEVFQRMPRPSRHEIGKKMAGHNPSGSFGHLSVIERLER